MSRGSRRRSRHNAEMLLFVIYCGTMLWLLFIKRWGTVSSGSVNLIPLETMKLYLRLLQGNNMSLIKHAFINLVGNVVVFIPLGWFIPRIWRSLRAFWKVFLLTIASVVLVELLQYFTGLGSCDVDDLLLNVPGAMFGYVLWKCTHHRT